jgi:very-short-patch-repair endonuclease
MKSVALKSFIMKSRVIERNMFYGASRNTFEKAHALRNNMTNAELVLWKRLKDRRRFKVRFRRQHPVDIFILDFYCHELRLAIEVDGKIHHKNEILEYDKGRTHDLEKLGIKLIRFTNDQIFNNLDEVQTVILNLINDIAPL